MTETFDHTVYQIVEFSDKKMVLSFEDTINYSIKWYISLFNGVNARFKVLEQLFFTNGCGYRWSKGRLVDSHFRTDAEITEYKRFRWNLECEDGKDGLKSKMAHMIETTQLSSILCDDDSDKEKYAKELVTLKEYASSFNPYLSMFIKESKIETLPDNISSYCMIASMPTNVKDDFLLGAVEAIDLYLNEFSSLYYEAKYQELINLKTNVFNKFGSRINSLRK